VTHLLDTNSWVDHLRHGVPSTVTAKLAAAARAPKPTKVYVVLTRPLFEPILESQPRHFLKVSSIRREKKCIIGHRDAGHFQIHRTDFDA
jgi:hypothetical protein